MTINLLKNYVYNLGKHMPLNCGNLGVASQYLLPINIIRKYTKQKKNKILDWGCGQGHISYLLLNENHDVQSYAHQNDDVKPVQNAVENILKKQWKLKQSDFSDPVGIPYPDESFDAVVSMGVLEHVRETGGNEESSLNEIYRILKPGGYFFCFHFPNKYSWIEALARKLKSAGANKFAHQFLYTNKDILNLVKGKFKIKEIGLYNLLPRSMLRHFNWLDTKFGVWCYTTLEKILSFFFKKLSQNYYFVIQK